jgi:hypothetical protein
VRLPGELTRESDTTLFVVLEPLGADLTRREIWIPPDTRGELDLGPVLPGAYETFMVGVLAGDSETAPRDPRSPRRTIQVEARAEQLVDL